MPRNPKKNKKNKKKPNIKKMLEDVTTLPGVCVMSEASILQQSPQLKKMFDDLKERAEDARRKAEPRLQSRANLIKQILELFNAPSLDASAQQFSKIVSEINNQWIVINLLFDLREFSSNQKTSLKIISVDERLYNLKRLSLIDCLLAIALYEQRQSNQLEDQKKLSETNTFGFLEVLVKCCPHFFFLELKINYLQDTGIEFTTDPYMPRIFYLLQLTGARWIGLQDELINRLIETTQKKNEKIIASLFFSNLKYPRKDPYISFASLNLNGAGFKFMDRYISVVNKLALDFFNEKDNKNKPDEKIPENSAISLLSHCVSDLNTLMEKIFRVGQEGTLFHGYHEASATQYPALLEFNFSAIQVETINPIKVLFIKNAVDIMGIVSAVINTVHFLIKMKLSYSINDEYKNDSLDVALNDFSLNFPSYQQESVKYMQHLSQALAEIYRSFFAETNNLVTLSKKHNSLKELYGIALKEIQSLTSEVDDFVFEKEAQQEIHDQLRKENTDLEEKYCVLLEDSQAKDQIMSQCEIKAKKQYQPKIMSLKLEREELQKEHAKAIADLKQKLKQSKKSNTESTNKLQQKVAGLNEKLSDLEIKKTTIENKLKEDIKKIKSSNEKKISLLMKRGEVLEEQVNNLCVQNRFFEQANKALLTKKKAQEEAIKELNSNNEDLSLKLRLKEQKQLGLADKQTQQDKEIQRLLLDNSALKETLENQQYSPYLVSEPGFYTVPSFKKSDAIEILNFIFKHLNGSPASLYVYGSSVKGSPYWCEDHSDIDLVLLSKGGLYATLRNIITDKLPDNMHLEYSDPYTQMTFKYRNQSIDITFKDNQKHSLKLILEDPLLDPLFVELIKKQEGGYAAGKAYHADWSLPNRVKFNNFTELLNQYLSIRDESQSKKLFFFFGKSVYLIKNCARFYANYNCDSVLQHLVFFLSMGHEFSDYNSVFFSGKVGLDLKSIKTAEILQTFLLSLQTRFDDLFKIEKPVYLKLLLPSQKTSLDFQHGLSVIEWLSGIVGAAIEKKKQKVSEINDSVAQPS
jgi:hypothetical protein